jgi:hypothetical protein
MKKKVKIFGKEIKRAVRRSLMENVMEQWEMGDTSPRNPDYRQTPREKGIEGMFGKYGGEIPSSVLRYMRKNPESVIKQLYDIYGNDIYKWLPQQSSLGGDWEFEEEEEMVGETSLNVANLGDAVGAEKAGFKGIIQIKKDLEESKKIKTVTVNEIKKLIKSKKKFNRNRR